MAQIPDFTPSVGRSEASSPDLLQWLTLIQRHVTDPKLLHLADALWLLANDASSSTFRCPVRKGAEAIGATALTYRRRRDALEAAGWISRTPFDRAAVYDPDRLWRRNDAERITLCTPSDLDLATSDTPPCQEGPVSLAAPRIPLKHDGNGGGSLYAPGHDRWGARNARRYVLRARMGDEFTAETLATEGGYKRPDALLRRLKAERLVAEIAPGVYRWADIAPATGRLRTLRERHALQRRQWWAFVERVRWVRRYETEEREDRLREIRKAARARGRRIRAVDAETGEVLEIAA